MDLPDHAREERDPTSPTPTTAEAAEPNVVARATPRSIAFYLPQFHTVPENDVFWGDGFTEWGNVARARPLFPGHYQPRLPADLGFYDLRLPETREAQADLAREHGVHGFCYYHYWFRGQRVLERPFQEVLRLGYPDFPFCLCWANHNWTWRRENKDRARLMSQEYSEEDDREHIRWLLDVFEDRRYIRVNGRPLLLIYMVQQMVDPARTFDLWRAEARKRGAEELYICKVDTAGNFQNPQDFGCDASVEFWPHGLDRLVRYSTFEALGRTNQVTEYEDLVEVHLDREKPPFKRYPCIVPHWDNTARFKPAGARIIHNSTPALYEHWMRGVVQKLAAEPPDEQLVFINAWNEWGEGAYLEPDYRYGRAYLEAHRRALKAAGAVVPTAPANGAQAPPPPTSAEELYGELRKKYKDLQRRHSELLAAEENSPLVQKLEDKFEKLARQYWAMNKRWREMRSERDLLIRQMRGVERNLGILFRSWQWSIGAVASKVGRRALGDPHAPTVKDELQEILSGFRESERRRAGRAGGEDTPSGGEE